MHRKSVKVAAVLAAAGSTVGAAAGCGGDPPAPTTADSAASAWVEAVNDRDWDRVCDLSIVPDERRCERLVERTFGDAAEDVALEGAYLNRSAGARTLVVAAASWEDGYVPLEVEQRGRRFLVRFDVVDVR